MSAVSSLIVAEIAVSRDDLPAAARQYAALGGSLTRTEEFDRAARVAADASQPTLVLGIAEQWIDRHPTSVPAQRAAARAALELHKIDLAVRHFQAVLRLNAGGPDGGFKGIAEDVADADNVYGARQVADELTRDPGASADALRVRGLAEAAADDAQSAIASLQRAIALEPSPELQWSLARSLAAVGRVEDALALGRRQIAERDDAANHIEYAVLLMDAHRDGAARAELELLAESADSKPQALRLMAQLQFQRGELDDAQSLFAQLIGTGKFVDDSFYYLGRIAEQRHQPQEALRAFVRVSAGDNVLPAMLHAAALLNQNGARAEADGLLMQMIHDNPTRATQIIAARAQLYADAHDEARAMTILEAAIAVYPDSTDLRYAHAEALERSQRVDAAIAELSALDRRRPNDPAAMNALGYTLADHAVQLTRARRLIEKAYAQAPQSAAIRDSMGWVLFRQGKAAEALPHLNAAYDADRGAETGAHLGEVLWSLGQHEEARRIWARALVADPQDRILLSTLSRLSPQDGKSSTPN